METVLGCIGLIGSYHFDEAESTGLVSVGVLHDGAPFHFTVFFEHSRDIAFIETRMDAGYEQVRAWITRTFIITIAVARRWWTAEDGSVYVVAETVLKVTYRESMRAPGEALRSRPPP